MAERQPSVLMVVEQLRRRVPGGIGMYARGLLTGVRQCDPAKTGADVTLLASRASRRDRMGPDGDPLDRLGYPLHAALLPSRLLTRAWDHGVCRASRGFDVVHAVSLATPRARGHRTSLVVTVHDMAWRRYPEATTRRGRLWHEAALGRAMAHATRLVTLSRAVAAQLQELGVAEERISLVPGGSDHLPPPDPAGADALVRRVGAPGPFVLAVGTLEPRKNLDRLLEAYRRVRPSLPEPWSLLVVGPPGWGRSLAPAPPGVVFASSVTDGVLAELYRRARALAYVPLTEGYGIPPLEAMQFGTPALVARGVPSVYDLGDSGPPPALLVDPLDVDDIAAGLATVLTDEAVRADLTSRGAAHARARTWRAAGAACLALWDSLR